VSYEIQTQIFCFISLFYLKKGTCFSAHQYKEALLVMLRKIILKEKNIQIFEVYM